MALTNVMFANDASGRHFRGEDRHLKVLAASNPELDEAAVARVSVSGGPVTSALRVFPASPP